MFSRNGKHSISPRDKDAGKPLAKKLTTDPTSRFLCLHKSLLMPCHSVAWQCGTGPKTCVPKLGQVIYHIYGPILGAEMQLLTCPVNSASVQSLSGLWAIWILISVLPRPFSTLETLRCFCILFEHEITRKLLEMINVNGFKIRYNNFSYSAQKQTLNLR